MKIAAVGLQMHNSPGLEKTAVTLQKKRRCKALLLTAYLRVGKGNPDLRNFVPAEKSLDEFDSRAQERHIRKMMLLGILRAFPQAGTFDVHTYIIDGRIAQGEVYCVLSLATTEFHHNRVVIFEKIACPMPLNRMILQCSVLLQEFTAMPCGVISCRVVNFHHSEDIGGGWLEKAGESLILPELSELVLSHFRSVLYSDSDCCRGF